MIRNIKVQIIEAEMMMKAPGYLVVFTKTLCGYGVKSGKSIKQEKEGHG